MPYDLFLSYNWRDREQVERVAAALHDRGLSVFLDRWYLLPGKPWPQALEEVLADCRAVAVFIGPNEMGPWQQREQYLALDRQNNDASFAVIPVLLPGSDPALGFLGLNTWVDLRNGAGDAAPLEVLAAAARGEAPGPEARRRVQALVASICPYRGLRAFREEDAPFFFGRNTYIDQLVEKVGVQSRHGLVGVAGASGSGKSSVVRAGLVPALRRGAGETVWDVVTLLPGDRPLHALAAAVVPLLEPEMGEIDRLRAIGELAGDFRGGKIALRDVVKRVLEKQTGTDRLLLVADQWEEVYTLARDEEEVRRFTDTLLQATVTVPLTAVLTVRGDFFGRVLSYCPLEDGLRDGIMTLGPMNREELEEVICRPAEKIGLRFEPGLANRLLEDVGDEPGNLPLLEFVLTSLWERRRGGELLHEAYDSMGGMRGAIARRADETYGKLDAAQQELVRRIFLQLVQAGSGAEDTRRRAILKEMEGSARETLGELARQRLLVAGRDEATGEETVEVAHEALIQNWSRLRDWLREDREFLLWRQRLGVALGEFERMGHDTGTLLRGTPLAEAEGWLRSRGEDLGSQECGFIEASAKSRNRRRWAFRGAGVAVAIVLLFYGIWQAREIERLRGIYEPIEPEMVDIPAGEFEMGDVFGDGASNERERPALGAEAFRRPARKARALKE